MPKFRKKPVVIEATQWFRYGDHPEDGKGDRGEFVVTQLDKRPDVRAKDKCKHCQLTLAKHGWVGTLEGGHIVCPGDWIITGVEGERYPCKPSIFQLTYEAIKE
jgi:hypothetical protein